MSSEELSVRGIFQLETRLLEPLLNEKETKLYVRIKPRKVTRICDTVYHDEQAAFRCNIKQPGCENVCFNKFSPISHVRFWGFEIIAVSLPSIIFIVFAAHEVARKFSKGLGSNNQKFGTVKGPIGRIGQKILSEEHETPELTETKKMNFNFFAILAKTIKKMLLNANSGRNIRFSKRQTPRGTV